MSNQINYRDATSTPVVRNKIDSAAHPAEHQSDNEAVTRAENEGMVLTNASVPKASVLPKGKSH